MPRPPLHGIGANEVMTSGHLVFASVRAKLFNSNKKNTVVYLNVKDHSGRVSEDSQEENGGSSHGDKQRENRFRKSI